MEQNGSAWLALFKRLSLQEHQIGPKGVFGEKSLPGVLVVDKIRYCLPTFLRDLEKPGKDFLDEEEVTSFTSSLIPLLSQSMHLHSQDISDYYRKAEKLKKEIMKICRSPARHLGIRAFQDIFTTHQNRLFHWVTDRRVPADNNRAERDFLSYRHCKKGELRLKLRCRGGDAINPQVRPPYTQQTKGQGVSGIDVQDHPRHDRRKP